MTIENLKNQIEQLDKTMRPYAIVCNPMVAEQIRDEFEHKFKILSFSACDENTCYVIDREEFERNYGGRI